MTDLEWMVSLANELDETHRQGHPRDEPEGACYITISDTLAKMISRRLRSIAENNGAFTLANRQTAVP